MNKYKLKAKAVLMVRPCNFCYNTETAETNAFQNNELTPETQQKRALEEFDNYVKILEDNNIQTFILQDTEEPYTPDSIFPNNWITFHTDAETDNRFKVIYPMCSPNRREERKPEALAKIEAAYPTRFTIDLTSQEQYGEFLEGTGSIVFDRINNTAYACKSPRTNINTLKMLCQMLHYQILFFEARGKDDTPIYHTNVMMSVAHEYAIICLASITNLSEREMVRETLQKAGKTIIEISMEQMEEYAGNMLQVFDREGKPHLVMSARAKASLTPEQIATIECFNPIIAVPIPTIEIHGGGSARCMLAEIY